MRDVPGPVSCPVLPALLQALQHYPFGPFWLPRSSAGPAEVWEPTLVANAAGLPASSLPDKLGLGLTATIRLLLRPPPCLLDLHLLSHACTAWLVWFVLPWVPSQNLSCRPPNTLVLTLPTLAKVVYYFAPWSRHICVSSMGRFLCAAGAAPSAAASRDLGQAKLPPLYQITSNSGPA